MLLRCVPLRLRTAIYAPERAADAISLLCVCEKVCLRGSACEVFARRRPAGRRCGDGVTFDWKNSESLVRCRQKAQANLTQIGGFARLALN